MEYIVHTHVTDIISIRISIIMMLVQSPPLPRQFMQQCRFLWTNHGMYDHRLHSHHPKHLQQQQQQQQLPSTMMKLQQCRLYHKCYPIHHNSSSNSSSTSRGRGGFDDYSKVLASSSSSPWYPNDSNENHTLSYGNALVIGSSGVLGRCIQQFLQQELHMNVLGADIVPPSLSNNDDASQQESQSQSQQQQPPRRRRRDYNDYPTDFCQLPTDVTTDLTTMTHTILKSVHTFVATNNSNHNSPHPYLDVIIVAAGGFEMNPTMVAAKKKKKKETLTHHPEIDMTVLQNSKAFVQSIERMYDQNFNPVVAAGIVAQHYMNPHLLHSTTTNDTTDNDDRTSTTTSMMKGTLLVAVGAAAALQPTPTMMGYGSAKNAIQNYVQSLGACTAGGIAAAAASDVFLNLKDKQQQNPMSTSHSNSASGSSPLLDSKLVRQAGRSIRKDFPSYEYLTVVGLLPTMLDTPRNRQSLVQEQQQDNNGASSSLLKKKNVTKLNGPHGTDAVAEVDDDNESQYDFSTTLIAPHDIAQEIGTWITTPALRPHSGAWIKVLPPLPPKPTNTNITTTTTTPGGARFELVR